MGNYKKNQKVSNLRNIEVEIQNTLKLLQGKGSFLRSIHNKEKKQYYIALTQYQKNIDKISELCDKLKEQLSIIEEEDARKNKHNKLTSETDPETGFITTIKNKYSKK